MKIIFRIITFLSNLILLRKRKRKDIGLLGLGPYRTTMKISPMPSLLELLMKSSRWRWDGHKGFPFFYCKISFFTTFISKECCLWYRSWATRWRWIKVTHDIFSEEDTKVLHRHLIKQVMEPELEHQKQQQKKQEMEEVVRKIRLEYKIAKDIIKKASVK